MKIIEVFNETTVCCRGEDSGGHPLIYLSLEGVDKGWSKPDPKNPALTLPGGYTKYKQQCVTKEKE